MDKLRRIYEYPKWHDAVRKDLADGRTTYAQLMNTYRMSSGRVTMLFGPKWKGYLVKDRAPSAEKKSRSIDQWLKLAETFEFVPVDVVRIGQKKKAVEDIPEDPMKLRTFERSTRTIDGKIQIGAIIRCGHEGCKTNLQYFSGSSVNPNYLAKEFEKRDWVVGAGPRADRCPEHSPKRRTKIDIATGDTSPLIPPKEEQKPLKSFADLAPPPPVETASIVTMEVVKPEPPRTFMDKVLEALAPAKKEEPVTAPQAFTPQAVDLDRMTKRIITSKLEEVYADEQTGYKGDWTDSKVAEGLNVPVEWVSGIREDMFGPELNATIVKEKTEEIRSFGENIERTAKLVDAKLEQMQKLDEKLSGVIEEIDGMMKRFEELTANLKTADAHNEELVKKFTDDYAQFVKLYSEFKGSGL